MKKIIPYILLFIAPFSQAQEALSDVLKQLNNESIPYITVEELYEIKNDVVVLDAREIDEYKVSHLDGSIFVGYKKFKLKSILELIPEKSQKIVVYCSLGVRSEDIAEQIKKAGYHHVLNLYGGIFEWKNKNFTVFDSENRATENIHVYNEYWSQWLHKGIKIYD